jgi:hypothetical protein
LGAEIISKYSYYERWIVAFSIILFEKSILTPELLARKMDDVAARFGTEVDSDDVAGVR